MDWLFYVVSAVIAAVVGVACFYGGVAYRRKVAEARIGSAEDEAKRIVNDAIKSAEQKRKE
ncbi:MAG: Rnase Y domain-containing protein, partial [Oscillospiraceae bacterium]